MKNYQNMFENKRSYNEKKINILSLIGIAAVEQQFWISAVCSQTTSHHMIQKPNKLADITVQWILLLGAIIMKYPGI